jgi:hypothetical protein
VLLGQIVGVLLHVLGQVLADQRLGHVPVGVEIDLVDIARHDRGGAIDAADDGGVALLDHAVVDSFDGGGGNVHNHVARVELCGHVLDAREIEVELLQALLVRHGHGVPGSFINLAVDDETVAGLEGADAGIGRGVENVVDVFDHRHIARGNQATLEGNDGARGLAEIEAIGFLRDGFPATGGNEGLILGNGELQIVDRVVGQDRLIGGDQLLSGSGGAALVCIAQHTIAREHIPDRLAFLGPCHGGQQRRAGSSDGHGLQKGTSIYPHIVT